MNGGNARRSPGGGVSARERESFSGEASAEKSQRSNCGLCVEGWAAARAGVPARHPQPAACPALFRAARILWRAEGGAASPFCSLLRASRKSFS